MDMTQDVWAKMTPAQKDQARDLSGLSPQLTKWKGWRVEVVTDYDETRRFIVGQSTGWRPCTLEIANRVSSGGGAADMHYKSVKALHFVR